MPGYQHGKKGPARGTVFPVPGATDLVRRIGVLNRRRDPFRLKQNTWRSTKRGGAFQLQNGTIVLLAHNHEKQSLCRPRETPRVGPAPDVHVVNK